MAIEIPKKNGDFGLLRGRINKANDDRFAREFFVWAPFEPGQIGGTIWDDLVCETDFIAKEDKVIWFLMGWQPITTERKTTREKAYATVDEAIKRFRDAYKQGDFDSIWDAASPNIKALGSEGDFIETLRRAQMQFGEVLDSKLIRSESSFSAKSSIVCAYFETHFQKKDRKELLAFEVIGGKAQLLEYKTSEQW